MGACATHQATFVARASSFLNRSGSCKPGFIFFLLPPHPNLCLSFQPVKWDCLLGIYLLLATSYLSEGLLGVNSRPWINPQVRGAKLLLTGVLETGWIQGRDLLQRMRWWLGAYSSSVLLPQGGVPSEMVPARAEDSEPLSFDSFWGLVLFIKFLDWKGWYCLWDGL